MPRFTPAPFLYRDFRVLWVATVLTGVAFVGETVVMGWLLLEATDSPFVVGIGVALRAIPNLLLGVPGGALADRVERRVLLRSLSFVMAAAPAVLGCLALISELMVWQILLFTFLGGCVRALNQAARQSYAFDVVGGGNVVVGTALMNLGQRAGGVIGSLGAGLILNELGTSTCYLATAVLFASAGLVLMLARSSGQAAPVSRPPVWQGVLELRTEVRRNPLLGLLVLLTAMVEILAFSYQALVPSIARDQLGLGPDGLGQLSAASAVGGLVMILGATLLGEMRHRGIILLVELHLYGVALILLAQADTLILAMAAIVIVSSLSALTDLLSQSLVQSAVPNDLRGRAMGSWVLAIGFGPVGHLQLGFMASLLGIAVALTTNGVALILLASFGLLRFRRVLQEPANKDIEPLPVP